MQEYNKEKHLKDLEYFKENQNELCKKYKGLVLLLQDAAVVNAFNSLREASDKGKEMFGYGNYSIQPCMESEQAYSMKARQRLIYYITLGIHRSFYASVAN